MTDTADARVAVYIDFDNIVISRYDQVHGRGQFMRDRAKGTLGDDARVDVGAIIDFAASFGTLVLTRAYADWSAPANADYRGQLVGRAVDLVQLFPAAAYAKNGADIRLAVDAVEDMFRLRDLTHVVVVAGDSDYVPLAQRCKRLGRYVVGIGVAGSTARSLTAACDEFVSYDDLPGVAAPKPPEPPKQERRDQERPEQERPEQERPEPSEGSELSQDEATRLFARALRVVHRRDDAEWLHSSVVKSQMKRMDPSFSEKPLGYRSFSDFVKSRGDIAELDESGTTHLVRQREESRRR